MLSEDVRWTDCKRKKTGTQRVCLVFIAKKITSSLERAQSFKIYIPDLFASIQLINSFWTGIIRGFFWAGVFIGSCITCSVRLL